MYETHKRLFDLHKTLYLNKSIYSQQKGPKIGYFDPTQLT